MANEDLIRASSVALAFGETSKGVAAKTPDPDDPTKRKGWRQLSQYFSVAAPCYPPNCATDLSAPYKDWCGIFALWALKTAGASWLGTWTDGKGIGQVGGIFPTSHPLPGDVGAKTENNHMALVYSVQGKNICTIDGNSINAGITGPSSKAREEFDQGFYSAFLSPIGTWSVKIGVFTWRYTFKSDGAARWSDIKQPPEKSGTGHWSPAGEVMEIAWDKSNWSDKSTENWKLPLQRSGQSGEWVGSGQRAPITADKIRDW